MKYFLVCVLIDHNSKHKPILLVFLNMTDNSLVVELFNFLLLPFVIKHVPILCFWNAVAAFKGVAQQCR